VKTLIKVAAREDVQQLTDVGARLFRQTYRGTISDSDIESHNEKHYQYDIQSRELEDSNVISLLVYCDDHLVGFSQIRRNNVSLETPLVCDIELWRIYLDQTVHGKGAAALLMDQIVGAGRQLKGTGLWLAVWDQNDRAIAYYQKHGFKKIGMQPFEIGLDIQNDLVLMLQLPEP